MSLIPSDEQNSVDMAECSQCHKIVKARGINLHMIKAHGIKGTTPYINSNPKPHAAATRTDRTSEEREETARTFGFIQCYIRERSHEAGISEQTLTANISELLRRSARR